MSEDYTYPTTPTLADLRARVAELERQLAQADSNMVALAARNAELERKNTELRADWVDKNEVLAQSVQVTAWADEFKARAEAAEAALAAIPTADLLFMIDPWADGTPTPERCEAAATAIETWAKAIKAVQDVEVML